MNLTLKREDFSPDGIFGYLRDTDGNVVFATLEHAFMPSPNAFRPKVPAGTYTCRRGLHRLHGMTEDFETFEITGVPDFLGKPVTGILFHVGNFNTDSEGCVLVGHARAGKVILSSRVAFADFMALQNGLDSFSLTVLDA